MTSSSLPTVSTYSSTHFVLLGQTPAISLHSAVLLLDVSFDLLVLSPLLFSPGHHVIGRDSARYKRNLMTKMYVIERLGFPMKLSEIGSLLKKKKKKLKSVNHLTWFISPYFPHHLNKTCCVTDGNELTRQL